MLDILHRSQRARICAFERNGMRIETPMIVSDTSEPLTLSVSGGTRFLEAFGDGRIGIDGRILMHSDTQKCRNGICVSGGYDISDTDNAYMIVIPNGFDLRNDFRNLLETITSIRKKIGYGRLLYVSGIAEPSDLALLAYIGIDVFDDVLCRAYGKRGIRCVPEGKIAAGCDETEANIEEMERECGKIKEFIKAGRLRELVDQRSSSPFNVAMLRILDDRFFEFQEEACVTAGNRFSCNTTQSLFRPEVLRFRERMTSEYRRPEHKKVLLLLPCSAKKPYHTSRSHKAFSSAIHTGSHDVFVHEVIVTSPLGAVPRELDIFFPANSYDIPVTGQWKCQELEFIRRAVRNIADRGYDAVVSHLGDDTKLVSGLFPDIIETCVDNDPASNESLNDLDRTLRNLTKRYGEGSYSVDRIETVRSVLSYQFGKDASDKIMDGTHVTGKFPYWKLFRGKEQIGMMTPERQMVSLTIEGAEILACLMNTVEIRDFDIKGNVFAIGVTDADPSIRIGDEAVVVSGGKVKAVGVAQMSGPEMKDMERGIAVKVRHKAK